MKQSLVNLLKMAVVFCLSVATYYFGYFKGIEKQKSEGTMVLWQKNIPGKEFSLLCEKSISDSDDSIVTLTFWHQCEGAPIESNKHGINGIR